MTELKRTELRNLLDKILENISDPDADEKQLDDLVDEFERLTEHPSGSDLMFWPAPGSDASIEGILNEVERWRLENGLPGFKAE